MDAKFRKPQCGISPLILSMLLVVSSSSLLSCEQKPQSMFEQQENTKSASENEINDDDSDSNTRVKTATTDNLNNSFATTIQVNKQQAIARQPNCDPLQTRCQYFELNILEFSPEQPWLTTIMWQTIARALAPETPLASQDQTAKKTVAMLFSQIEYSEKVVTSLPMYQRIDTELVINPITDSAVTGQDASSLGPSDNNIATGYLVVRSKQHRSDSQQQLIYVMLDMQKQLQLTIEDILLAEVSTDELLVAFQTVKKEWLTLQGIEQKYHEDWPLHLSRQWYLNEQGLHMFYQSGELLNAKTDAVDMVVPYHRLQGLIKPRYIVQSAIDSKS